MSWGFTCVDNEDVIGANTNRTAPSVDFRLISVAPFTNMV